MQFRNDIQGLRALAFLLVFFFHLNSNWLPGGFLGVDLFFVISGYLITMITLNDIDKQRFSFIIFFEKRFKRIIPAYFAFLIIIISLSSLVYLYTDIRTLAISAYKSARFASNIYFANGESYFGAKLSENPFLHTWSLAIEMQFYLILPFLLYFLRKYLVLLFIIAIIGISFYTSYEIIYLEAQQKAYFSLFSRIPEFLIGSVYAIIFKNGVDFSRKKNNLLASISFLIIVICSFFYSEHTHFPGVPALLPCIAGANLLIVRNNIISEFFEKKLPVYIGKLSYSLYLWHWGVMALLRYMKDSYKFTITETIIVSILAFIMAWISYNLIENRFRKIKTIRFATIFASIFIIIYQ